MCAIFLLYFIYAFTDIKSEPTFDRDYGIMFRMPYFSLLPIASANFIIKLPRETDWHENSQSTFCWPFCAHNNPQTPAASVQFSARHDNSTPTRNSIYLCWCTCKECHEKHFSSFGSDSFKMCTKRILFSNPEPYESCRTAFIGPLFGEQTMWIASAAAKWAVEEARICRNAGALWGWCVCCGDAAEIHINAGKLHRTSDDWWRNGREPAVTPAITIYRSFIFLPTCMPICESFVWNVVWQMLGCILGRHRYCAASERNS